MTIIFLIHMSFSSLSCGHLSSLYHMAIFLSVTPPQVIADCCEMIPQPPIQEKEQTQLSLPISCRTCNLDNGWFGWPYVSLSYLKILLEWGIQNLSAVLHKSWAVLARHSGFLFFPTLALCQRTGWGGQEIGMQQTWKIWTDPQDFSLPSQDSPSIFTLFHWRGEGVFSCLLSSMQWSSKQWHQFVQNF